MITVDRAKGLVTRDYSAQYRFKNTNGSLGPIQTQSIIDLACISEYSKTALTIHGNNFAKNYFIDETKGGYFDDNNIHPPKSNIGRFFVEATSVDDKDIDDNHPDNQTFYAEQFLCKYNRQLWTNMTNIRPNDPLDKLSAMQQWSLENFIDQVASFGFASTATNNVSNVFSDVAPGTSAKGDNAYMEALDKTKITAVSFANARNNLLNLYNTCASNEKVMIGSNHLTMSPQMMYQIVRGAYETYNCYAIEYPYYFCGEYYIDNGKNYGFYLLLIKTNEEQQNLLETIKSTDKNNILVFNTVQKMHFGGAAEVGSKKQFWLYSDDDEDNRYPFSLNTAPYEIIPEDLTKRAIQNTEFEWENEKPVAPINYSWDWKEVTENPFAGNEDFENLKNFHIYYHHYYDYGKQIEETFTLQKNDGFPASFDTYFAPGHQNVLGEIPYSNLQYQRAASPRWNLNLDDVKPFSIMTNFKGVQGSQKLINNIKYKQSISISPNFYDEDVLASLRNRAGSRFAPIRCSYDIMEAKDANVPNEKILTLYSGQIIEQGRIKQKYYPPITIQEILDDENQSQLLHSEIKKPNDDENKDVGLGILEDSYVYVLKIDSPPIENDDIDARTAFARWLSDTVERKYQSDEYIRADFQNTIDALDKNSMDIVDIRIIGFKDTIPYTDFFEEVSVLPSDDMTQYKIFNSRNTSLAYRLKKNLPDRSCFFTDEICFEPPTPIDFSNYATISIYANETAKKQLRRTDNNHLYEKHYINFVLTKIENYYKETKKFTLVHDPYKEDEDFLLEGECYVVSIVKIDLENSQVKIAIEKKANKNEGKSYGQSLEVPYLIFGTDNLREVQKIKYTTEEARKAVKNRGYYLGFSFSKNDIGFTVEDYASRYNNNDISILFRPEINEDRINPENYNLLKGKGINSFKNLHSRNIMGYLDNKKLTWQPVIPEGETGAFSTTPNFRGLLTLDENIISSGFAIKAQYYNFLADLAKKITFTVHNCINCISGGCQTVNSTNRGDSSVNSAVNKYGIMNQMNDVYFGLLPPTAPDLGDVTQFKGDKDISLFKSKYEWFKSMGYVCFEDWGSPIDDLLLVEDDPDEELTDRQKELLEQNKNFTKALVKKLTNKTYQKTLIYFVQKYTQKIIHGSQLTQHHEIDLSSTPYNRDLLQEISLSFAQDERGYFSFSVAIDENNKNHLIVSNLEGKYQEDNLEHDLTLNFSADNANVIEISEDGKATINFDPETEEVYAFFMWKRLTLDQWWVDMFKGSVAFRINKRTENPNYGKNSIQLTNNGEVIEPIQTITLYSSNYHNYTVDNTYKKDLASCINKVEKILNFFRKDWTQGILDFLQEHGDQEYSYEVTNSSTGEIRTVTLNYDNIQFGQYKHLITTSTGDLYHPNTEIYDNIIATYNEDIKDIEIAPNTITTIDESGESHTETDEEATKEAKLIYSLNAGVPKFKPQDRVDCIIEANYTNTMVQALTNKAYFLNKNDTGALGMTPKNKYSKSLYALRQAIEPYYFFTETYEYLKNLNYSEKSSILPLILENYIYVGQYCIILDVGYAYRDMIGTSELERTLIPAWQIIEFLYDNVSQTQIIIKRKDKN